MPNDTPYIIKGGSRNTNVTAISFRYTCENFDAKTTEGFTGSEAKNSLSLAKKQ